MSEEGNGRKFMDIIHAALKQNKSDARRAFGKDGAAIMGKQLEQDYFNTNPETIVSRFVEVYVNENRLRVAARNEAAVAMMRNFEAELNDASDALEAALTKFDRATEGYIKKVRDTRMSLTSEQQTILTSIKDVADFMVVLYDGPALRSLLELSQIAQTMHGLFGENAMGKLAEALLIVADRKEVSR